MCNEKYRRCLAGNPANENNEPLMRSTQLRKYNNGRMTRPCRRYCRVSGKYIKCLVVVATGNDQHRAAAVEWHFAMYIKASLLWPYARARGDAIKHAQMCSFLKRYGIVSWLKIWGGRRATKGVTDIRAGVWGSTALCPAYRRESKFWYGQIWPK